MGKVKAPGSKMGIRISVSIRSPAEGVRQLPVVGDAAARRFTPACSISNRIDRNA